MCFILLIRSGAFNHFFLLPMYDIYFDNSYTLIDFYVSFDSLIVDNQAQKSKILFNVHHETYNQIAENLSWTESNSAFL